MTGPLNRIDIRGRGGRLLRDKWADGPRTYLGLTCAGFPNLFTITGPQSPSVLSNMPVSIEQHVDFIARIIDRPARPRRDDHRAHGRRPRTPGSRTTRARPSATLFPTADTWYMGANIPGKPRVFMPNLGLRRPLPRQVRRIAANDYEGFTISSASEGAIA